MYYVYENFEEFNCFDDVFKENLLRGIYGYGFEKPSQIQSQSILPFVKGKDVIITGKSGAGKIVFNHDKGKSIGLLMSLLEIIDPNINKTQALIFCSTKEFSANLENIAKSLSTYLNISTFAFKDPMENLKDMNQHQIIIGTPERIDNNIKKNLFETDSIKFLLYLEIVSLFSKGFQDNIMDVHSHFEKNNNKLQIKVGITMSSKLEDNYCQLLYSLVKNPKEIVLKNEELTLEGIKQYYVNCEKEEWKFEMIIDLISNIDFGQALVFCNNCKSVEKLHQYLTNKNCSTGKYHEKMDYVSLETEKTNFRLGKTRMLIANDYLDKSTLIININLSINYDVSPDRELYVRRFGRSGAFGFVINFVTKDDIQFLVEIEKYYNTQIEELPMDLTDIF